MSENESERMRAKVRMRGEGSYTWCIAPVSPTQEC